MCGPAVSPAGQVIVSNAGTAAVSFLGTVLWTLSFDAVGLVHAPSIASDGTIFFAEAPLVAYRDGAFLWRQDFDGPGVPQHPPLITSSGAMVYMVSEDDQRGIYIVGPDGRVQASYRREPGWDLETDLFSGMRLAPVIPTKGLLVYPTDHLGIEALEVPVEATDPAAWSHENGNKANTRSFFAAKPADVPR